MKKKDYLPIILVGFVLSLYLSNDMYLPALNQIMSDLAVGHHLVQLTLTTWFFGGVFMTIFMGGGIAVFGRQFSLLACSVSFICASLYCAVSTNIYGLIIARFFQGLAVPTVYAVAYALIHERYQQKKAIAVTAQVFSMTILAPAFGPMLGSVLLLLGNWHNIFLMLAIGHALAVCFLLRCMPEDCAANKTASSLAIKLLISDVKQAISHSIFRNYALMYALLAGFYYTWIIAAPIIVTGALHWSATQYGLLQVAAYSLYALNAQFMHRILRYFSLKWIMDRSIPLLILFALFACLLSYIWPGHLIAYVGVICLMHGILSPMFAIVNRLAVESSPSRMSITMMLIALGVLSAGVIMSALFSYLSTTNLLTLSYVYLGIIAVISLLYFVSLRSQIHRNHLKQQSQNCLGVCPDI